MTSAKCHRCGNWWSHQAVGDEYAAIHKFCPLCIPLAVPNRMLSENELMVLEIQERERSRRCGAAAG